MSIDFDIYIQSGAATCSEGFATWLLRVPQAVGPYFSCHAAQSSEGNFQKNRLQNLRNKLSPKTVKVDKLAPIFAMVNVSVKSLRSDSFSQLFGDSGSGVTSGEGGEGGEGFEKKSLIFF